MRRTKQPKTTEQQGAQEKPTRRTLFEASEEAKKEEKAMTEYKTFYNRDTVKQKGKEDRWKRQEASLEERSMQAATPSTAKKKTTVPTKAQALSKKMDEQLEQARSMMDKMQQALAEQDHPPYIAEMQQQMQSMQDTMTHLEQITTNLRQDITDVEIMANYVHDTLYTQQQKDASIQTVAKGWPTNFSESERDSVIQWYAEKQASEASSQLRMADTCTAGTKSLRSQSCTGNRSGPRTLLNLTFTSITTSGIQSPSGTGRTTWFTTARNSTESASHHKQVKWSDKSTWQCKQLFISSPSQSRAIWQVPGIDSQQSGKTNSQSRHLTTWWSLRSSETTKTRSSYTYTFIRTTTTSSTKTGWPDGRKQMQKRNVPTTMTMCTSWSLQCWEAMRNTVLCETPNLAMRQRVPVPAMRRTTLSLD